MLVHLNVGNIRKAIGAQAGEMNEFVQKPQEINKIKSNLLNNEQNEPYIFHFKIYIKPWFGIAKGKNNLICFDFFPRFYEYARKTKYYFDILEKFACFQK